MYQSLNSSTETITLWNSGHMEKTTYALTCTESICFSAYLNLFHIPGDLLQSHSWFGSCWIVDFCAKNECSLTCSWSLGEPNSLPFSIMINKLKNKTSHAHVKPKVVYVHFIEPYFRLASVAYLYWRCSWIGSKLRWEV